MIHLKDIPKIKNLDQTNPQYEDKLISAFEIIYQQDYDLVFKEQNKQRSALTKKIIAHVLNKEFESHLSAIIDRYKITPLNEEIHYNNLCKILTLAGKYIYETDADFTKPLEPDYFQLSHQNRPMNINLKELQQRYPSQKNNLYLVEFPGIRLPSGIISYAINAVALRRETNANNLENIALLKRGMKYRTEK